MTTNIYSRDLVKLRDINSLDYTDTVGLDDDLVIGQDGALKRTTAGDIFDTANEAALEAVDDLSDEIYSVLTGYVDTTSNQTVGGVKTFTNEGSGGALVLNTPDGQISTLRFNNGGPLAYQLVKGADNSFTLANSGASSSIVMTQAGALTLTSSSWSISSAGAFTGNAATATRLATARTINGVSFDGTANITVTANATALQGFNIQSATPTDGQLLAYSTANTRWQPTTLTTVTSEAQTWAGVKTFSSSPLVPTAAVGTNTTAAASTAFVQSEVNSPVYGEWPLNNYNLALTSTVDTTPTLIAPTTYAGSGFSTTGFTVPAGQGGLYYVELYAELVASGNNLDTAVLAIKKNETSFFRRNQLNFKDGLAYINTLGVMINLSAGDVIRPQFRVDFGTGTCSLQNLSFLAHKMNSY